MRRLLRSVSTDSLRQTPRGRDAGEFGLRGLSLLTVAPPLAWLDLAPIGRDGVRVRTVAPVGFDGYARLLSPFYRTGVAGSEPVPVRWSEVASWAGRSIHPEVQWEAIVERARPTAPERPWDQTPLRGQPDRQDLVALVDVLRRFTPLLGTCFYALWDGYGGLPDAAGEQVRLDTAERGYLLFSGPLPTHQQLLTGWPQTPELWWPEDRSWYLGTDVDLFSVYIGGSAELISAVLAEPRLEALPARVDDRIDIDGDEPNWQPPRAGAGA